MLWNNRQNLADLRDILAALYPTVQSSRVVVVDVGLNPSLIEFSSAAVQNWFAILEQARHRSKVDALVERARADYPEDAFLLLARQQSALRVPGSRDIREDVRWRGPQTLGGLEAIISSQSSLVPIHFLELGLQRARAVARVLCASGDGGSGFLVQGNLLITNNHVIPTAEKARSAIVQFNYQKTVDGLDAPIREYRLLPEQLFRTSEEDDWTAVLVAGEPARDWGSLKLERVALKGDERVNIIQHPGGRQKELSYFHNTLVFSDEKRLQYLTDTQPGSSGSPVFDAQWRVVGVHHSGGWLPEPGANPKHLSFRNQGIHINVIIDGLPKA